MQKRNVLSSPRLLELIKLRRRVILSKLLISLLALSAFFCLLVYLSRLDSLNISDVQISGNNVVDSQSIKETVEKIIAGKYFWFVPKSNILLYPKNTIKNELQSEFKRLGDVKLAVQNNKTLLISVSERTAKYTWCGTSTEINANPQQCFFLDEDGYIFDKAPFFSGEVYFKFYGSDDLFSPGNSNQSDPTGSYFFKQNFKKLIALKDGLAGIGLKPVSINITDDGDIETFLSKGATSEIGPKIIIKMDADLQNVAENLQAALTTEPLQSDFVNKYSKLLYIDLRFGNKVYYKFL